MHGGIELTQGSVHTPQDSVDMFINDEARKILVPVVTWNYSARNLPMNRIRDDPDTDAKRLRRGYYNVRILLSWKNG